MKKKKTHRTPSSDTANATNDGNQIHMSQPTIVKRTLFSWIFAENLKFQILLAMIIFIMVGVNIIPLELQKRIINETIRLQKPDLLVRYCIIYLVALLAASVMKFLVNYLQSYIGQKTLARMRRELYSHIITLPVGFFRKTQPGTVISSLVTEIAAAGDAAGTIFAETATSLLTLIAFSAYLISLNPVLAIVSMAIYPLVLLVVPQLQKQVNIANKKRVDSTRVMSNRINESIGGIHEIHVNGAFGTENKRFGIIVDQLMKIRIQWNLFKYSVKVTNNFINKLSPFIIFLLGGYFVMNGKLELGSLVAFLSAQEKISDPWKELITNYQLYQDAAVRYDRTMQLFDMEKEHLLLPTDRQPFSLKPIVEVKHLTYVTEDGIRLLNGITFSLQPGEQMALVGFSGSGKSTLAQCIGQLYPYTAGEVKIDGKDVSRLTKADMAATMGFVSQDPFIFSGTIEENILYSCASIVENIDETASFQIQVQDEDELGMADHNETASLEKQDPDEDELGMTDHTLVPHGASSGREKVNGVDGDTAPIEIKQKNRLSSLPEREGIIAVLHQTGLFVDVLRFGLNTVLNPVKDQELMTHLVSVRKSFQAEFSDDLSDIVEFFDEHRYLNHSTILSNITFGTAEMALFKEDRLLQNGYFLHFLDEADLTRPLMTMGADMSRQIVDIFSMMPPDELLFEESPISHDRLDDYRQLVTRLKTKRIHDLTDKERLMLLEPALGFIPGKHKMIGFPKILENLILEGRAMFKKMILEDHPGAFQFYDPERYIDSQSILNNIFFGRSKTALQKDTERIHKSVVRLLEDQNLLETILEIGYQFQVGDKGDNLSGGQKQKLAIARVLLKEPSILILDEATSALDNASQTQIQQFLHNSWRGRSTIISVVHRLDTVKHYDRIAVMKNGEIIEMGTYDDLIRDKGVFYELAFGQSQL